MARSRWVLVKLATGLSGKFRDDWARIAPAQRRAWARLVLFGIIGALAALFGAMAALKAVLGASNHLAWEEDVLRGIASGPISFGTGVWVQTFGADFMLLFVVLVTSALAVWHDRPLLAVTILLSLLSMDLVVRIGWFSLERHRPQLIADGIASPAFHSFPSGHTAKTLSVYGLLGAQWIRASHSSTEKLMVVMLTALICAMVPFGRLRMGVHWPTDIAGGYLVGAVWLVFALFALRHERLRPKD